MVLGRFIDIIVALGVAAWFAMAGMTGEVRAAVYDVSRLDRMPDFTQTDSRLGLPGGGSHYCVPVATANVLVWLAEHRGYKNLLPVQGLTTIEKVASVAGRLGSNEFMSTAPKGGTNLQRFVDGLSGFISQQGYRPSLETYGIYGFRNVARSNVGAPDWRSIRSSFARGAGVWVGVSFFKEGRSRGELEYTGGHMTTMAGFGVDERGATNREVIILHDPDDSRNATLQRRFLNPEPVRNAFASHGDARIDLDDYLDVSSSFRMPKGHRAIITSVFVLDI
jgi:hypothetical protein